MRHLIQLINGKRNVDIFCCTFNDSLRIFKYIFILIFCNYAAFLWKLWKKNYEIDISTSVVMNDKN